MSIFMLPGDCIGHDQRRRGEVVGAYERVHAAFKVAVSRQYRGDHEIVILDRGFDILIRAGPELPMQVVQP